MMILTTRSLSLQTPNSIPRNINKTHPNNQSPSSPENLFLPFLQHEHSRSSNPIQSPPPSPSHPTSSSPIQLSHPHPQSKLPSVQLPLKSPQFYPRSIAGVIPLPLPSAIVVVIRRSEGNPGFGGGSWRVKGMYR